jgi:Zn-dependent protease with chaperone function
LIFALFIVLFQYAIGPWIIEHCLDIYSGEGASVLPAANAAFVEKLCADRGLNVPKCGIIESGTPNAFSFSRVRGDARVVVIRSLLDALTVEESNAVSAHEIGHIEHYDFAVITVASLAPLMLYQIYIFTRGNKSSLRAIAYGAYIAYWVSQFVVLLINRQREFYADHCAADVTHQPDALSSALVKIAYGMVQFESRYREAMAGNDKEEKGRWRKQWST